MGQRYSQRPYQRKSDPWLPPQWYLTAAPRWRLVLDDLERRGGQHNEPIDRWSVELGIPEDSLRRVLHRLEEFGLVAVVRQYAVGSLAGGRRPNRYDLLVTWEQWDRHKDRIAYRVQAERTNRNKRNERARKSAQRKVELRQDAELRAIERAALRIEAAFAMADAALGYRPDVLVADDDVTGWT